jgi:nucleoside phosphorylase
VTRVLVVAATEPELCGRAGLVCGVGPVEAAWATSRALALEPADAVLHVGGAGGRGLALGTLVVASQSVYCDLSAAVPVVSRIASDEHLLARVREALPDIVVAPIGTSAAVGGPCGAWPDELPVEAMEGFAVLRACALAGVPAVEVRAISNDVGEPDRARWEIGNALEALTASLPKLLSALRE